MKNEVLMACISLSVFAASCQPGSPAPRNLKSGFDAKSSNVKSGCRDSQQELVGGKDTTGFESVVLLMDQLAESSFQLCTGTFIGPNTLITAGHCIDPSDILGVRYVPGNVLPNQLAAGFSRGVAPSKVLHHGSNYLGRSINASLTSVRDRDVAVLIFDQDIAPASMPLASSFPMLDSLVDIVGFGSTTFAVRTPNHIYRRQTGRNRISNISAFGFEGLGIIASKTTTNAEDVLVSVGDSGGALIFQGKLAGVTSALASPSGNQGLGLFANLSLGHNIELLGKARSLGAKIGPVVAPGSGSNSGSSGASDSDRDTKSGKNDSSEKEVKDSSKSDNSTGSPRADSDEDCD